MGDRFKQDLPWALVALALAASSAGGPALASGPDVHAGELAVTARIGKQTRPFFPTAYATPSAVCGVVSSRDGDARFVVEFVVNPKGKPSPGPVFIDGLPDPPSADGKPPLAFLARWSADCSADSVREGQR